MSDILIKGMEMPIGGRILIVFPSGRVLEVSADATQEIFKETQAVPVPPHGDLIERNALSKHITVEWFCGNKRMNVPWRAVEDAPTVLPAEEGEI